MESKCWKCDSTVHEGSKFCATCGHSLEKKRRGALFWIAAVFGGLMLVGIIGGMIASNSSGPTADSKSSLSAEASKASHLRATRLTKVTVDCGKPQKIRDEQGRAGVSDIRWVTYGNTELAFYRDSPVDEWIFGNAFAVGDDDTMSNEQASRRMSCVKGGLHDLLETDVNSSDQNRAEALKKLSSSARRICEDHPTYEPDICDVISKKRIRVGMTATQARLSWGAPQSVNTTTTQFGRVEQWVYGIGSYVYVERGVVTSMQTSR